MPEQSPLIALVDDDPVHVALVQLFLAEQGYRTVCCFQGSAALDLIRQQHPDLVLLDMQMEQRDTGLRVLEAIRHTATTASLPVILCSADWLFLHEYAQQIAALHADCLEKPFALEHLTRLIQAALGAIRPHSSGDLPRDDGGNVALAKPGLGVAKELV